ncbi:MAG: hypothetical protein JWN63_92 [Candidatus Acidoferrum typicum]|nr:hypothetical protein [Candidatus Acidoferrum typicum]
MDPPRESPRSGYHRNLLGIERLLVWQHCIHGFAISNTCGLQRGG